MALENTPLSDGADDGFGVHEPSGYANRLCPVSLPVMLPGYDQDSSQRAAVTIRQPSVGQRTKIYIPEHTYTP